MPMALEERFKANLLEISLENTLHGPSDKLSLHDPSQRPLTAVQKLGQGKLYNEGPN